MIQLKRKRSFFLSITIRIMTNELKTRTKARAIDARTLGFGAVATLLGAGFAIAMSASADTNSFARRERNTDRHDAMVSALAEGNFQAWKELVGERPIAEKITEENFDAFVELHEAVEENDTEKVQALRNELGLPERGKGMRGMGGHALGRGNSENREAIEAAMEHGDYDAWKALVADKPIAGKITEENFATFSKLREAMEAHDEEQVEVLRKELGLGQGVGQGMHGTQGVGKGKGGFGHGMGMRDR